jgi:hypothetical protein
MVEEVKKLYVASGATNAWKKEVAEGSRQSRIPARRGSGIRGRSSRRRKRQQAERAAAWLPRRRELERFRGRISPLAKGEAAFRTRKG